MPKIARQVRETRATEKLRQSSVSSPGKAQYCFYCQNRNLKLWKTRCCKIFQLKVSKEALNKPENL